jgi:hypothetical protein
MSTWEPIWMSEGAWETLRDQVIGPAEAEARRAGAADATGLAQLLETWQDARRDGARVGVFLTPELAEVLATLLDQRPELAGLLGG